jgi:hypothetical protein
MHRWTLLLRLAAAAVLAMSVAPSSFASTPLSMHLYNNTEHEIRVVNPKTGKIWTHLAPGLSFRFVYTDGVVLYTLDGRQLRYGRTEPPPEWVQGGLFARSCKAQFNSDDTISLLHPADRFPAVKRVQQPPGFPLKPE